MAKNFVVNFEIRNEDGTIDSKIDVFSRTLTAPTHIKDVGLNHFEQINVLQNILDNLLPQQFNLIEADPKCQECGRITSKNGVISSNFHTVFTDHKVNIQRVTCKHCSWRNKYTIEALFGTASHPDLVKIQCELGSENSFKKAENILLKQNNVYRKINNHVSIMHTIEKIGPILSNFKLEEPKSIPFAADILVAQIDGGHIQPKEKDIRSYEVLVAKCYNLENKVEKDQHHTELLKSTCVASALSDHGETIKKQLIYAALSEGMTDKTVVYALSDGAKNCWSALSVLSEKCSQLIKILDWVHIGRKLKHVEQSLPEEFQVQLERATWKLWHGKSNECIEKLEFIKASLKNIENKKLDTLIEYLINNEKYLINYGEQKNNGLPYTSNVIESAVDTLINERQKKNKKMSWTREGAHNILQIRSSIASKTWERDWEDAFEVLIAA
jgi:hypothetical protein